MDQRVVLPSCKDIVRSQNDYSFNFEKSMSQKEIIIRHNIFQMTKILEHNQFDKIKPINHQCMVQKLHSLYDELDKEMKDIKLPPIFNITNPFSHLLHVLEEPDTFPLIYFSHFNSLQQHYMLDCLRTICNRLNLQLRFIILPNFTDICIECISHYVFLETDTVYQRVTKFIKHIINQFNFQLNNVDYFIIDQYRHECDKKYAIDSIDERLLKDPINCDHFTKIPQRKCYKCFPCNIITVKKIHLKKLCVKFPKMEQFMNDVNSLITTVDHPHEFIRVSTAFYIIAYYRGFKITFEDFADFIDIDQLKIVVDKTKMIF